VLKNVSEALVHNGYADAIVAENASRLVGGRTASRPTKCVLANSHVDDGCAWSSDAASSRRRRGSSERSIVTVEAELARMNSYTFYTWPFTGSVHRKIIGINLAWTHLIHFGIFITELGHLPDSREEDVSKSLYRGLLQQLAFANSQRFIVPPLTTVQIV
jgi:hypothetical protein